MDCGGDFWGVEGGGEGGDDPIVKCEVEFNACMEQVDDPAICAAKLEICLSNLP